MSANSLESLLQKVGNPVPMLRNSKIGAYIFPVVPPEFTNWRDEQLACREACVLLDQSHHMVDIYITGPDALKLLSDTAINSFAKFTPEKAKQYIACNYDGYVIGDGILFHLEENNLVFVGRAPCANWIEYHAQTGKYDVKIVRDERSPSRPMGKAVTRISYRYQIQGPNAWALLEKVNGGPLPDIKFFNMDYINIAGRKVRALKHGMARAPGVEIWGPYEEGDEIKAALIEAGEEFGLRQVGSRAYPTLALESGWIPAPLPAVYTGDKMKPFREWLSDTSYEANGSLGGSFVSDNIEDYYLTPYDLGYGPFVKFDHEFIGDEALKAMADKPHRNKVTLVWNNEDVSKVLTSIFNKDNFKYLEMPISAFYSTSPYDRVTKNGKTVGISSTAGFSWNERFSFSLAMVDPDIEEGSEVVLVWGEPDGGSEKTTVERHKQTEIRATVRPAPYPVD